MHGFTIILLGNNNDFAELPLKYKYLKYNNFSIYNGNRKYFWKYFQNTFNNIPTLKIVYEQNLILFVCKMNVTLYLNCDIIYVLFSIDMIVIYFHTVPLQNLKLPIP